MLVHGEERTKAGKHNELGSLQAIALRDCIDEHMRPYHARLRHSQHTEHVHGLFAQDQHVLLLVTMITAEFVDSSCRLTYTARLTLP